MAAITTPPAAEPKHCSRCTDLIHPDRVLALPNTNVCMTCSRTSGSDLPNMVAIVYRNGDVDVVPASEMKFTSDGCQS